MLGSSGVDGSGPDRIEMRDEIMTQFLAGTETTAAAICWALEFLTRHPASSSACARRSRRDGRHVSDGGGARGAAARPADPADRPREVVKPVEIGGVR
ncbi:cytochrome P450 [Streptomyces sp. M19]